MVTREELAEYGIDQVSGVMAAQVLVMAGQNGAAVACLNDHLVSANAMLKRVLVEGLSDEDLATVRESYRMFDADKAATEAGQ
jgi:hypothetical protein